ncbi:Vacuolar protein-sorting-associated protein 27 [Linnemannia zychae]|nr:Vacuolar protein-sorting-associated protein 27 [Linnemannia zychae]
MSWLWSASPIDELVDKATSENLPAGSEDLALNLEICDQIRSKQVSPKDAAKALKRRIGHKNPNVQMLALGLTDVCVKNGGHHFLVEVAAREFIDNLTSILKAPAGCNLEVKNRILALIQTWGLLFRGKHGLGYVCDTYMILQHEGFQFPPKDNVGAALVESEAPPDWTDSDVCTRCRSTFTLTNRKHHCRACGSTFCGQCSSKTMALPNMGVTQEVRVCDGCWMKKKLGPKSVVALESHGLGGGLEYIPSAAKTGTPAATAHSSSKPSGTSSSTSAARTAADDDADLLKAIELSLKESNNQPGYSAPKRTNTEPAKKTPAPTEEEEDADLLAAIEASLRETNIRSSSSSAAPRSSQRQSSYSSYTYSKKPIAAAVVSQHELTDTEKSNIEMFSVLVDRIQMMQGDVAGNREVQALYEQISKLQMKLALSIEEASRKQQEFVGFNDKIDHAVRIYDHLLQERLNSSYQRRMNATNYAQPGMYNSPVTPQTPQTSHIYPQMSNPDSRYAQYVPTSGPYGGAPPSAQQTPQIPFQQAPYQQQPLQQQQQPSYPYQPNPPPQSSGAPGAYNVASPVAPDQQPYSTAPVQQTPYGSQPQQQQPIQQQQQQPSTQPQQQQQQQQFAPQYQSSVPQQFANGSVAPVVSSPVVQSSVPANGQLPVSNGYQPIGQSIQSPPQQQPQQQAFAPVAQQSTYVPYDPQQQQQQQPLQQQQPVQQSLSQLPAIQPQFSGSTAPTQSQYAPYQQQPPQQQAYAPVAQPVAQPKVEEAPLIEL